MIKLFMSSFYSSILNPKDHSDAMERFESAFANFDTIFTPTPALAPVRQRELNTVQAKSFSLNGLFFFDSVDQFNEQFPKITNVEFEMKGGAVYTIRPFIRGGPDSPMLWIVYNTDTPLLELMKLKTKGNIKFVSPNKLSNYDQVQANVIEYMLGIEITNFIKADLPFREKSLKCARKLAEMGYGRNAHFNQ